MHQQIYRYTYIYGTSLYTHMQFHVPLIILKHTLPTCTCVCLHTHMCPCVACSQTCTFTNSHVYSCTCLQKETQYNCIIRWIHIFIFAQHAVLWPNCSLTIVPFQALRMFIIFFSFTEVSFTCIFIYFFSINSQMWKCLIREYTYVKGF